MTLHDQAERLFKPKPKQDANGLGTPADYEQRALADREKTVKLRALRAARDANPSAKEATRRKTDQMLRRQKLADSRA